MVQRTACEAQPKAIESTISGSRLYSESLPGQGTLAPVQTSTGGCALKADGDDESRPTQSCLRYTSERENFLDCAKADLFPRTRPLELPQPRVTRSYHSSQHRRTVSIRLARQFLGGYSGPWDDVARPSHVLDVSRAVAATLVRPSRSCSQHIPSDPITIQVSVCHQPLAASWDGPPH